jgi:hypothetical protein
MSRKRRFFGGPLRLADATYATDHDYRPATQFLPQNLHNVEDGEPPAQPLRRALIDATVQAVPTLNSSSMQTTW